MTWARGSMLLARASVGGIAATPAGKATQDAATPGTTWTRCGEARGDCCRGVGSSSGARSGFTDRTPAMAHCPRTLGSGGKREAVALAGWARDSRADARLRGTLPDTGWGSTRGKRGVARDMGGRAARRGEKNGAVTSSWVDFSIMGAGGNGRAVGEEEQ